MSVHEDVTAQCPDCLSIRMVTEKMARWKKTIVTFNNLPKELCYACKIKKTDERPDGV